MRDSNFLTGHLALTPWGHCEIVPISHSKSVLRAEEETWIEIARFKSCLERMFEREGKTPLYLESAVNTSSSKGHGGNSRHTVIDVIPVNISQLKEVIVYFREVSKSTIRPSYRHSNRFKRRS